MGFENEKIQENIIELLENIKTPNDILEFMKRNIEYGWIDECNEIHIKSMKDFRKKYRTLSIEDVLKYKIGTCIEQVFLMHQLFNKINIKNKMFCSRIFEPDDYNNLEEEEHMHCFLLYYLNNKVYHIEHPNFEKIGIYEYNNEKEAFDSIVDYYINLRGRKRKSS